jgi:hypothetical protein
MVPCKSILCDLAQKIITEHKAAEAAARSALDHAHAAGVLLTEAKNAVGHGRFGAWHAEKLYTSGSEGATVEIRELLESDSESRSERQAP